MNEELEKQQDQTKGLFERLAVLQAIFKAVGEETSRANDNSIRSQCDVALMNMYEQYGIDRAKLTVMGEPVGNLSIVFTKAHAEITNYKQYEDWCVSNGYATIIHEIDTELMSCEDLDELYKEHPEWFHIRTVIGRDLMDQMKRSPSGAVYFEDTGEVVPGLTWVPDKPDTTILTQFKKDKVFNALSAAGVLFDTKALLGGGE